MKAIERAERELAEARRRLTDELVTNAALDFPTMRYMQGVVFGLSEAIQEITDTRKRYDEEDDDASSDPEQSAAQAEPGPKTQRGRQWQ